MALSAAFPALHACARHDPLTIAIHPWIGYETLSLAREFGWLPDQIEWLKTDNLGASTDALSKKQVDAACTTLDGLLACREAGVPLQAVLVFDISAGADVVVCQPDIETPTELNGKRIAYEDNALGQLMLAMLLERAGLEHAAVRPVVCPPEMQLQAWQAGEIDAAITYEPVASLLRRAGARQLMSSREVPDKIIDILAVNSERLPQVLPQLRAVTATHFRGLDYLLTNREDAIYRIAARQKLTPEEVRLSLAGIIQPSREANQEYLKPVQGRLKGAAADLATLMTRHALLKKPPLLNMLSTTMALDF